MPRVPLFARPTKGQPGWRPRLLGLFFEGPETPEANFPRAGPATGAKKRPVAAAFAQPGLPANLANFGRDHPARWENAGRAEGSASRPFLSRRFAGTERERAQWPSTALGAGRRKRAFCPSQAPWRTLYSMGPEFNAF